MSKLLKSSGAVAAATFLSRILGFLRETAYSGFYGDTAVASAFVLAFTIPNLFRRLLGEGALTAVFVPVFLRKEKSDGLEATWHGAAAVVSAVAAFCTAATVLVILVASVLITWVPMEVRHELTLRILRCIIPYAILICTTAVFVAILNARGQFFLPALGAATMNVVMIASVYWITPWFGTELDDQVFGLALGVVLSGIAQAAFQIPALRRAGFQFKWVTPWKDPTVRETLRRLGPAVLGVAAYQFNVVITQMIADHQAEYVVASYGYAVRLLELPQGVIGISVATFLLTELSRQAADQRYPDFRNTLREGILHLVFINGLAGILLIVLAEPTVRLLFEHGRFTADSTARAALALQFLAPGLLATSITGVLSRAFYALDDTRTPMRIGVFCLGMNVVLVFLFAGQFRQGGLAAANTLSALTNASLLFYAFRRKMPKFEIAALVPPGLRMLGVALFAATLGGIAAYLWETRIGHVGKWRQAGAVFLPGALALAAHIGLGLAIGLAPARELAGTLRRKILRQSAA